MIYSMAKGGTTSWYATTLALTSLAFLLLQVQSAQGKCSELGRCCTGKSNSACKYDYGFTKGRFARACYCDEFCTKSGDCCSDYESYCLSKAQDCVMENWSHWSRCNARCGKGKRERRRSIYIQPSKGGQKCGVRRQVQGCYHQDIRCKHHQMAQLIPARWNYYRNIPDKYERPFIVDREKRKSYCIHYTITKIAWYCRQTSPYHVLKVGSKVCAQCDDTAMSSKGKCKGSYHDGGISRWKSLQGSCYGTWQSEGKKEVDCQCSTAPGMDFIFV